jgi:hypothetical protein
MTWEASFGTVRSETVGSYVGLVTTKVQRE